MNEQESHRARLLVVLSGVLLLWTVGGYGDGYGSGLFWVVAASAALAAALPRPLPNTARSAIWSGIVVIVVCLAANLERIVPPEGHPELAQASQFDRLATTVFGLGVTALFFRPSSITVTVVTVAVMPLTMMALTQVSIPSSGPRQAAIVWGTLMLVALLHQAHRLMQRRPGHGLAPGVREGVVRAAIVLTGLGLAFAICSPIEWGARTTREYLFGLLSYVNRGSSASGHASGRLSLRSPPADVAGRIRALMAVSAPEVPGYLREEVFTTYAGGEWTVADRKGRPLIPSGEDGGTTSRLHQGVVGQAASSAEVLEGDPYYALGVSSNQPADLWRCQVLEADSLGGFCLPGQAVALQTSGGVPVGDADGAVTPASGEPLPDHFRMAVASTFDPAYPLPAGSPGDAYLTVPVHLVGPVSNWVAACADLSAARTAQGASLAIVVHFREHFAYRLGVTCPPRTDPLVGFMDRRTGHCTLFASAAAMMLRARGIPTRVVGGFMCTERNPFNGTWVMRERDGHAWVEAWDAAAGRWFLVEATPPAGQPTAYSRANTWRHLREWVTMGWRKLVTALRQTPFLALLAAAGIAIYSFVQRWLWNPVGLMLLLTLLAVWMWRRRRRHQAIPESEQLRSELVRHMMRYERRAIPARLRRQPNESWFDWVARVTPELSPDQAATLTRTATAYQALRYRARLDPKAVRKWMDGG